MNYKPIVMCNCLEKSEKNITKFIVKDKGLENIRESGYTNKVLAFGNGGGIKLVMPFEVTYAPKKVNGTLGRKRTYKTSIFPTYCPFCGKKNESVLT